MLWNTSPDQIRAIEGQLRGQGMLLHTGHMLDAPLQAADIDPPDEPIDFFVIPPSAHFVGKLVVPFVAMNEFGYPEPDEQQLFGVTTRPNTFNDSYMRREIRSREVHVYAEEQALDAGIMMPGSRITAERKALAAMTPIFRAAYTRDWIAHLRALESEAGNYHERTYTPRARGTVLRGLANGISFLEDQLEEFE